MENTVHTPRRIKMSAVMPNYNGAQFLSRSIQSLLDQSEAFDEIIIVDDGSTDESVRMIESYVQQYPHVRLIKHAKNQGVNAATNTGLAHASGDYILFCATDDWFGPNVVAVSKQAAKKYPGVGVICGDGLIERFDLKKPFYRALPYPANTFLTAETFKAFTRKSYVGFTSAGGMFMHRQAILDAGGTKPATRWHGDWLLYFVVALRHGIYYFNDLFIHVDMRAASYSEGKRNKKIQNEVMLETINIIANDYPDLWDDFKRAGLVPHHALRYIPLFLLDPIARRFISKRLIWKILINNSMVVRVGRLFPYHFILMARKWLRA